MTDEKIQTANPPDPTLNVRSMIKEITDNLNDLRKAEVKRIDEKIGDLDDKYQIQFSDSKEAVVTALSTTKEAMSKAEMVTKEAINKADQANEKRFDTVNESSAKLSEQQTKLLTRTEYDAAHKSLAEKIDGVENRINRTEGASNIYVTQTDLSSEMNKLRADFQAMLLPVATKLSDVTTFMNGQTAVKQSSNENWGRTFAIIGATGIIVGIVMKFVFTTP